MALLAHQKSDLPPINIPNSHHSPSHSSLSAKTKMRDGRGERVEEVEKEPLFVRDIMPYF
jgi:hypothetical protein